MLFWASIWLHDAAKNETCAEIWPTGKCCILVFCNGVFRSVRHVALCYMTARLLCTEPRSCRGLALRSDGQDFWCFVKIIVENCSFCILYKMSTLNLHLVISLFLSITIAGPPFADQFVGGVVPYRPFSPTVWIKLFRCHPCWYTFQFNQKLFWWLEIRYKVLAIV